MKILIWVLSNSYPNLVSYLVFELCSRVHLQLAVGRSSLIVHDIRSGVFHSPLVGIPPLGGDAGDEGRGGRWGGWGPVVPKGGGMEAIASRSFRQGTATASICCVLAVVFRWCGFFEVVGIVADMLGPSYKSPHPIELHLKPLALSFVHQPSWAPSSSSTFNSKPLREKMKLLDSNRLK